MIMNIVFVTFLYGSIMPVLFPIAWCQLFMLYAVERLMMFYSYQRFPIFDDRITRSTIYGLYAAPVLFLAMAMLAFSNEKVFANKVVKLDPEMVFPRPDGLYSIFK